MTGNDERLRTVPLPGARGPREGIFRPRALATAGSLLAAVLMAAGVPGCDGGIPGSERERTIPREAFIEAMVELRAAADRGPEARVTSPDRERILSELGVTSEQLIRFAEVHGRNVPLMNQVWEEVNRRIWERTEGEEDDIGPPPPPRRRAPVSAPGS